MGNTDSQGKTGAVTEDERDWFLYKASHDLKAPLASIIGLTTIAKEEVRDETALKYLSMIERSTQKMNTTITDLLQFTRIKKGVIQMTKIDLQELISEIVAALQYANPKVGFRIRVENKNVFHSDKNLLACIVQNIADNAIKYRREQADSFVSIEADDYSKGVRITIADNGIGIDKENSDKVFNMFFRASEQSTGTGLGLYIVKNAVSKLNGIIELASELNRGTTMTVYIPDSTETEGNS